MCIRDRFVISFLAKFLRLDGIAARIRAVLDSVRNKVNAVLDKVATWVVGLARKAGKLGKDGEETRLDASATTPVDALGTPPEATFADDDETHRISARMEGDVFVATVSSETKHLDEYLDFAEKSDKFDAKAKATQLNDARTAIATLRAAFKKLSDPKQRRNLAANRIAAQAAENAVASALK